MKDRVCFLIGLLLVSALVSGSALAEEKGHLELKTTAQQEIEKFNEEGKKVVERVPAAKVIPGDVVIYTISYKNISEEAAENVFITNPVPEHMTYVDGSVEGEGTVITFSADGGATYAAPDALRVTSPDNSSRPAPLGLHSHPVGSRPKRIPGGDRRGRLPGGTSIMYLIKYKLQGNSHEAMGKY